MAKLPPKRRQLTGRRARRVKPRKGMVTFWHGTSASGKRNILREGLQKDFHKGLPTRVYGLTRQKKNVPVLTKQSDYAKQVALHFNNFGPNKVHPKAHLVRVTLPKGKVSRFLGKSPNESLSKAVVKIGPKGKPFYTYPSVQVKKGRKDVHVTGTAYYLKANRIPRKYLG